MRACKWRFYSPPATSHVEGAPWNERRARFKGGKARLFCPSCPEGRLALVFTGITGGEGVHGLAHRADIISGGGSLCRQSVTIFAVACA